MPEGLKPGLAGEVTVLVSDANTAETFGNAGAKVYATPMLVALMEQAAIKAIHPYLLPGEGSVGTRIEMIHMAATPVGLTVRARAELVEIVGKRLVFEISAADGVETVGKCRHERYIVSNMAAFLDKTMGKQTRNA